MLDHKELLELHDKAYLANQTTRQRAASDMVFYHITHWEDGLLSQSNLEYQGQFDILRKAGRQIMGDLKANPVQVDFQPKVETRDDGADLIDGLYRADDRINTTIEAYGNGTNEAVVCGLGGWELYTEYESNRAGVDSQVIRRRPLYEFNNNVLCDPNAKLLDKSDAKYWSILVPYSEEGYEDLVEELTGEEDKAQVSFKSPEQSYSFPWIGSGQQKLIYVTRFYHRKKVKDTIYTMENDMGETLLLRKSDITEIEDELISSGYSIVSEKSIKRWQVTLYIASGKEILKTYDIAGENLPVVPVYGERAFVEGEEHWEGITRLAKDPQILRDFQMSYLADIVSRSPRPKPIFLAEQIGQYKNMYDGGPDNNFPYYLQERYDADGKELPIGPVAQMPEQTVPNALIQSISLSREAVSDVAPANITSEISDVDLSGKALLEMQRRLDDQSIIYQQNLKHAKRRDAEIYAGMASVVYDQPRSVNVTLPDGTRKTQEIMSMIMDDESGEMVVINDLTNSEFEVYADIGQNYSTKREETLETLGNMAERMAATDPQMAGELMLQQLTLMEGVAMEPIRENARKKQILSGFIEPDTDEEKAMMEQASQEQQQPDANMAMAQAEQTKGDAAMMREETARFNVQNQASNRDAATQIDQFKATTDRLGVQVDAQKAGAELQFKRAEAMSRNVRESNSSFRARVSQ